MHGRSIALQAVRCDAPNLVEGQIPQTVALLDQSVEAHVSSNRLPIDDGSAATVCDGLASDRALYTDAVFGTEWQVSQTVSALVKELAATARADHVWVPLVRTQPACATGGAPRDSYSTGTALLDFEATPGCEARESDLGLFLFDADGALVWKSSAVAGRSELATTEAATRMLLADLPARTPTEGVLVNDTVP